MAPLHPSLLSAAAALLDVDVGPALEDTTTISTNEQHIPLTAYPFPVVKDTVQEDRLLSWQAEQDTTAAQLLDWPGSTDQLEPWCAHPSNGLFIPGGGDLQLQLSHTRYSGLETAQGPSLNDVGQTADAAADLSPEEAALLEDDDFRLILLGTL